MDIGLGDLIKKMEEYCGVTYTKWLIRSLSLALFIWVIDFALIHGLDTRLRDVLAIFEVKESMLKAFVFSVGVGVGATPLLFAGDFFIALYTRRLSEKAEKNKREADQKIAELKRMEVIVSKSTKVHALETILMVIQLQLRLEKNRQLMEEIVSLLEYEKSAFKGDEGDKPEFERNIDNYIQKFRGEIA